MKLLVAYIRPECTSNVMRALYKAGMGGISAYEVRGLRAETKSSLYTHHPFELYHLDEAVKLEAIVADESIDRMVSLIAEYARTGEPGDGVIAVQEVNNLMRIRDIKQPS